MGNKGKGCNIDTALLLDGVNVGIVSMDTTNQKLGNQMVFEL